ncbi:MAG: hypothetical protein NVSMB44_47550 [Ktedonobacteraceae bacterium]
MSVKKRTYTMSARAQTSRETEQRVLEGSLRLFSEHLYDNVSLDQIAELAGVTVQTIIRRFGSKEQLFSIATLPRLKQVYQDRMDEPIGDTEITLGSLLKHYEEWGKFILHLQFQKERIPSIQLAVATGRHAHIEWLKRSFAPQLQRLPVLVHRIRFAQLVAITDIFTWYTLRHEQGLSNDEIRSALRELINALFEK